MNALIDTMQRLFDFIGKSIPEWGIALLARGAIAYTFWSSGRSKVSGFLDISDSTFLLFEHEYGVPLIPPNIAAHMATYAEHFFPILLVLGLFTRFAALSLLIMTAVIQLFVYPDAWNVHMWWALAMLYLIRHGGGLVSLDRLLWK
ncbi:MAG: DoxX family protein [Candidatus Thiodiazotropha sp. (ex Lucina aurantia)]|uniref:DoxX n=2 Tax=Candidatus Thiodiazotropha TaxID=1913444 RepID=A0A7Z0VLF8_9GAMM|nr:DoxX family protein [Candidatus Thiodiazotropha endolucinida]MBT3010492.1 DoxX family protein [Candidatus Thiodiazotropha sp. (ex Lucina pensylvanica)]MBT3016235.1 DoxX family protein [Candidatus Thiodiazotropha taylori]MBT3042734.1 DoxX family protein [Candidatus Thiodiazotropha sp. (ex Codakia orbicularis)]MBV2102231.1 DoxX family protein [Candidatus Thiodiazotropha sp. (ex Lucina aurantia)]MBT3022172.1 DoxX family protein [Candidatus Thiodiazotropha taylori]